MITESWRVAVRYAWLPDGLQHHVALEIGEDGRIVAIDVARPGELVLPGLLMPGWVNSHTHIELAQHAHPVGAVGTGSPAWVQALGATALPASAASRFRGACALRALGAAFCVDTANGAGTAEALAAAGLRGVVQREAIGLVPERWAPQLASVGPGANGVVERVTAHSPISCSPELLTAALTAAGPMATIHCDEDPADHALLARREGPWRAFHGALAARLPSHPFETALGTAPSGVSLLAALGLLGPRLGLVHLVAATPADLDLVAEAGATVILCPRSNLHISGRLPDVRGMVQRNIPLAVGTDSRASVPDGDLLAELALLRRSFPDVPAIVWLSALTVGGARLLAEECGEISVGARPGLLLVDLPESAHPLERLLDGTRWPRRWLT